MSPWADPKFRAVVGVLLCIFVLMIWKFIVDWDKMRDEARRERHIRKHRWWRD